VVAPATLKEQFESKLILLNANPLIYSPVELTLSRSAVPAAMITVLDNPELTTLLPMMVLLTPVVSAAPAQKPMAMLQPVALLKHNAL
jgi:hypothetical protein